MILKPTIFGLLTVALSSHPVALLVVMLFGCVAHGCYVAIKKPFKSKWNNGLLVFMEILICVLIIMLTAVIGTDNSDKK